MNKSNELLNIFKVELNKDVDSLLVKIESNDDEFLFSFAHKYKVRLHYLNYLDSYNKCLKIEDCYRKGETQDLRKHAFSLYSELILIEKKIN